MGQWQCILPPAHSTCSGIYTVVDQSVAGHAATPVGVITLIVRRIVIVSGCNECRMTCREEGTVARDFLLRAPWVVLLALVDLNKLIKHDFFVNSETRGRFPC